MNCAPETLPFQNANKLQILRTAVTVARKESGELPLVYVNRQFVDLTGFDPEECIGRDCKFLQGPNTNPETVRKIAEAISYEVPINICILNYRKDGESFHNLLMLTPFRSLDGQNLFLGCQYELLSRALRIEEHVSRFDGLVGMISAPDGSAWSQTLDSMKMRTQAIKSLVSRYQTHIPVGR